MTESHPVTPGSAPDSLLGRAGARAPAPGEGADLPAMRALAEAMRLVRERCVWTHEMTHEGLLRYLLEESHELVEAVHSRDAGHVREELGDVLLQVVFHAEIARDTAEGYDLDAVAAATLEKLVRRHPHVFGAEGAATVAEVERAWGAAKAREKSARRSLFDGIAPSLPGLARAQKVAGRIAAAERGSAMVGGMAAAATATAAPATAAPATSATTGSGPAAALFSADEELGDLLYAIAGRAEALGLDAESALQGALARARERAEPAPGAVPAVPASPAEPTPGSRPAE